MAIAVLIMASGETLRAGNLLETYDPGFEKYPAGGPPGYINPPSWAPIWGSVGWNITNAPQWQATRTGNQNVFLNPGYLMAMPSTWARVYPNRSYRLEIDVLGRSDQHSTMQGKWATTGHYALLMGTDNSTFWDNLVRSTGNRTWTGGNQSYRLSMEFTTADEGLPGGRGWFSLVLGNLSSSTDRPHLAYDNIRLTAVSACNDTFVTNGGFEQYTPGWNGNAAAGWSTGTDSGTMNYSVDTTVSSAGGAAVKMWSSGGVGFVAKTVSTVQFGDILRVKARVKTALTQGSSRLYMRFYDASGAALGVHPVGSVSGNRDWTALDDLVLVPQKAATLTLAFYMGVPAASGGGSAASGTMWIDEVSLTPEKPVFWFVGPNASTYQAEFDEAKARGAQVVALYSNAFVHPGTEMQWTKDALDYADAIGLKVLLEAYHMYTNPNTVLTSSFTFPGESQPRRYADLYSDDKPDRAPCSTTLADLVKQTKDKPALLGWYIGDEPDGRLYHMYKNGAVTRDTSKFPLNQHAPGGMGMEYYLQKASDIVKANDPDPTHLRAIAFYFEGWRFPTNASPTAQTLFKESYDIMLNDMRAYPAKRDNHWGNGSIEFNFAKANPSINGNIFSLFDQTSVAIAESGRPLWYVGQATGNIDPPWDTRLPTRAENQFLLFYPFLAFGANMRATGYWGLPWSADSIAEPSMPFTGDGDAWKAGVYLPDLEIFEAMSDALASNALVNGATSSNTVVKCALYKSPEWASHNPGSYYLLAVNTANSAVTANLNIDPAASGIENHWTNTATDILNGNGAFSGWSCSRTFAPFEVKAWRLGLQILSNPGFEIGNPIPSSWSANLASCTVGQGYSRSGSGGIRVFNQQTSPDAGLVQNHPTLLNSVKKCGPGTYRFVGYFRGTASGESIRVLMRTGFRGQISQSVESTPLTPNQWTRVETTFYSPWSGEIPSSFSVVIQSANRTEFWADDVSLTKDPGSL